MPDHDTRDPGGLFSARWPALDFPVPEDRIASRPVDRRADSRLLWLRRSGGLSHHRFRDLPALLRPGDRLVVNDTRVMHARLEARRASGGAVELVLLQPGPGPVRALARPARKLRPGDVLSVGDGAVEVLENHGGGELTVRCTPEPEALMRAAGAVPLPPYLRRAAEPADAVRYQTVYARELGSAAAPTAGLHFDEAVLEALRAAGVEVSAVTLHVGLGTFLPLREQQVEAGALHEERYVVPAEAAEAIARTRAEGGRVIAVGTTSARALESATAAGARSPTPGAGRTTLFVQPPYTFRAIDGLITNFHLPGTSLLLLVAALAGEDRIREAYDTAVSEGYRFFSYGDAMLIV